MISYAEALVRIEANLQVLGVERLPVADAVGRVSAEIVKARINCPHGDVSRKDGYALSADQVLNASPSTPLSFRVTGEIKAGDQDLIQPASNETVAINTGAQLPENCNGVIAEEQVKIHDDHILITDSFTSGFNVLRKGSDIRVDEVVAEKGQRFSPQDIGLITGAGHEHVSVIRKPNVHLISTGSELTVPGKCLTPGSLYPSNLNTQVAWFNYLDIPVKMSMVKDSLTDLTHVIRAARSESDVIIISGGAWKSDRDYTAAALQNIGWEKSFHRLRLGPGKASGFGKIGTSTVFILPGGPPSNIVAFLKIVLPGLRILSGFTRDVNRHISAVLSEEITYRNPGWTDVKFITLAHHAETYEASLCRHSQRLKNLALAHGIFTIQEGSDDFPAGSRVDIEIINPYCPL